MENKLFKSSAFGGFKRQDVLNYIESASKKSAESMEKQRQELEDLRKRLAGAEEKCRAELEDLRTENMQLQADLQAAGEEREGLIQQKDTLAAQLEEQRAENSRLAAEGERNSEELDALSSKVDELQAKIARVEPEAVAYQTMKRHMAEIEVSAYQRAEAIETSAREQSDRVYTRLINLLSQSKQRFSAVQSGFEVTASHVSGELQKMQESLSRLSSAFDGIGAEFEAISLPELDGGLPPKADAPEEAGTGENEGGE